MKKPRTRDDVVVKLRQHVDAGVTLKALVEHPAFGGFFNAERASLIEAMVGAKIGDDVGRREAAVRIDLLEKFRQHLLDVVRRAERAGAELDKLEGNAHDAS